MAHLGYQAGCCQRAAAMRAPAPRCAPQAAQTGKVAVAAAAAVPAAVTATTAGQQQTRRQLLQLLTCGVAGLTTAVFVPQPAQAVVSSSGALEEYMKLEDEDKLRDQKSLDNIRGKYGIRRLIDGHVQLRRKDGTWMSVRLDMEVPGAILLRDSKSGAVYALETDSLPQVDLSDDYVLFMMFADGQWEEQMTAIEFEDEGKAGKTLQLVMDEKEFRSFVGLLKEPNDEPVQGRRR
eukprot:GHRR01009118.1.p1 GENE.GHRR01009118.1~~GHRR01009118.1.p1  ORF type:complete len:235 (+),score=90.90 GHRR01009118.1:190-894(+)